jgi:hypothetical protein
VFDAFSGKNALQLRVQFGLSTQFPFNLDETSITKFDAKVSFIFYFLAIIKETFTAHEGVLVNCSF